jgi:hypothetical protein
MLTTVPSLPTTRSFAREPILPAHVLPYFHRGHEVFLL